MALPAAEANPVLRATLLGVAVVSLVLAVIGAILPVMPGTPFFLVAVWAARRSSPRLAAWMIASLAAACFVVAVWFGKRWVDFDD